MHTLSTLARLPRLGVGLIACALSFSARSGLAAPAGAEPGAPKPAASASGAAKPATTPATPKKAAGTATKKGASDAAAATAGSPDAATKKAAREAYSAGEKAYSAGDYTTAYEDFRKAHDLIPTIHAEYWMAMAQSYGSDVSAAYDSLAAVVSSPEAPKLGEEKVASATARLEELKKAPVAVSLTSVPPGAEVSVDGAAQPGVTPLTVNLTPGTHHVGLGLKGYDAYETDVAVNPGQKLDQNIELKKSPVLPPPVITAAPPPKPAAPPPAPPPPKEPRNPVPAYITLGVGGVGAIIGTVFGVQALGAKSDFDKNPTNSNADRAERDALIADMGFAVALTLGITGIVLLVSDDTSEVTAHEEHAHKAARARLDFAPVVTHTSQGAAARLTF